MNNYSQALYEVKKKLQWWHRPRSIQGYPSKSLGQMQTKVEKKNERDEFFLKRDLKIKKIWRTIYSDKRRSFSELNEYDL